MNNKRIGIDLDNTIICYQGSFATVATELNLLPHNWSGRKDDLKGEILLRPEGERLWQMVQGRVYGAGIVDAELFPGVERFLRRSQYLGHEVFIVSHKTEYGHFDPSRVSLRQSALSWLKSQQVVGETLGLTAKNIFFADTRSDKVGKIAELDLDVFIDDLREVFDEPLFPGIEKVLFSEQAELFAEGLICRDWHEIEERVLGWADEQEIGSWLSEACGITVEKIQPVRGGGNNRLFRVTDNQEFDCAVKIYPDPSIDPRPRLKAEMLGCELTEHLDVTPVMRTHEQCLNFAVFDWVEGAPPRIDHECVRQAVRFAKKLKEIHLSVGHSTPLASEACLSIAEIFGQLDKRISALAGNTDVNLGRFLDDTLFPLRVRLGDWVGNRWSPESQSVEVPLIRQTLSPSDFGFHNALQKADGTLCFLDLEYFGRDDPVKLIADFLWHPGMDLSDTQGEFWLGEMFQVFGEDPELKERFSTSWPLFGLRWVLIILNEFREDGWTKRMDANHRIPAKLSERKEQQLAKAVGICEMIDQNELRCPYV